NPAHTLSALELERWVAGCPSEGSIQNASDEGFLGLIGAPPVAFLPSLVERSILHDLELEACKPRLQRLAVKAREAGRRNRPSREVWQVIRLALLVDAPSGPRGDGSVRRSRRCRATPSVEV